MPDILEFVAHEKDDYGFCYSPSVFSEVAEARMANVIVKMAKLQFTDIIWSDPLLKLILNLEAKDFLISSFAFKYCVHRMSISKRKLSPATCDLFAKEHAIRELALHHASPDDFVYSIGENEPIAEGFLGRFQSLRRRGETPIFTGGKVVTVKFSNLRNDQLPNFFACRIRRILGYFSKNDRSSQIATISLCFKELYLRALMNYKTLDVDGICEHQENKIRTLDRFEKAVGPGTAIRPHLSELVTFIRKMSLYIPPQTAATFVVDQGNGPEFMLTAAAKHATKLVKLESYKFLKVKLGL